MFSFEDKNYISLRDLHEITKMIIFRNMYSGDKIFRMSDDFYDFILQSMSLNTLEGAKYGYT